MEQKFFNRLDMERKQCYHKFGGTILEQKKGVKQAYDH